MRVISLLVLILSFGFSGNCLAKGHGTPLGSESVALTRGETAPFDGALMPREAVTETRRKLTELRARRAEAEALRRLVAARDVELVASRSREQDTAKVAARAETALRAQKKRNALERAVFSILTLLLL